MQKLTEEFNRRVDTDTPTKARATVRLRHWLNQAEALGSSHRATATLVGVAWVSSVGLVHLNLARAIRFDFFYLLGCAAVGWVAGTRGALLVTLVSGLFLYLAEVSQQSNGGEWIFHINSLVRLVAFGLIGWVAAKVGADARDLERTVALRTERLQLEVEEHKETSEMVREAGQLFQQLTENITDVFWVTDPLKREVEYISPGFERVWGKSCESLRQAPSAWIEGIHHEDRERVTRAMLNQQIVGEYDEEYRVVRTDGAVRWVHDRAFPVKDETGAVYRLVGIAERQPTNEIDRQQGNTRRPMFKSPSGIQLSLDMYSALHRGTRHAKSLASNIAGVALQLVGMIDAEHFR